MAMTWTEPAFEAVTRLVGVRTGLVFTPERRVGVEQGIRRAMSRAGVSTPSRYGERLADDPALLDDLVDELTVGETYFFREPEQFQFVRRVVLPEVRARRGPEHAIRAWSAGCSSGEEAYSLAILFEQEGQGGRSSLLATDISPAALAKARRASYGAWSFRGEAQAMAFPYLERSGNCQVVSERIRGRVTFATLNLARDDYPSPASGAWGMDLIFCRNVLIYLDRATIREVARRLYGTLAPGGWLIAASSDPPLSHEAPFETVVTDHGVFYRQGPATASDVVRSWGYASIGPLLAPASPSALAGVVHRPPRAVPQGPGGPAVARPSPRVVGVDEGLAAAREDLARGDYAGAAERTRGLGDDPEACALHVRALANLDAPEAERACAGAIARHPFSCELNFLRSQLLAELGRDDEACASARRVIYLDRSLAVAHFFLGTLLRRRGDLEGARRAYRNAHTLCASVPADEGLPLSGGEPAGRLARAARAEMARLGDAPGEGPR